MRWSLGISAVLCWVRKLSHCVMFNVLQTMVDPLLQTPGKSHVADLVGRSTLWIYRTCGREVLNSDTPSSNTIMYYLSLLASALLLLPLIACSGTLVG